MTPSKQKPLSEAAIHKAVTGYPDYFVSATGEVFSVNGRSGVKWLQLNPEVGYRGHLRVTLFNTAGKRRVGVHRLVLECFVGPPPTEQHFACHWDDNPANNAVENLYWGTAAENARDAVRNGRWAVGSRNHFSRLTEADVLAIAQRAGEGADALAQVFDTDRANINRIIKGRSWRHVERPVVASVKRPPTSPEALAIALELVASGTSINGAAKVTGVNRKAIYSGLTPVMKEKQIHSAVIQHWRVFGLPNTLVATMANEYAHGQPGLTRGLPDLLILAPSLPVGFIELKSETGRVSEAQLHFQTHCERLHIPFAITRGRDEPIKLLELWGVVRGQT